MSMNNFPNDRNMDAEEAERREPLPPEPEKTHLDRGQVEDPDSEDERDTRGNAPVEGL